VIEATSDGGKTWHTLMSQSSAPASWHQFSFISEATGYELTTTSSQLPAATILQETTDGGKTWSTVRQFPTGDWGQAVYFRSAAVGWVAIETSPTSASAQTVIMKTTDGGKTWTESPVPGAALQPNNSSLALQFADGQHGWLMGLTSFYSTSDGGATWGKQP
jgi:photosystem II stability/assembly factor-like uncharacterized protein